MRIYVVERLDGCSNIAKMSAPVPNLVDTKGFTLPSQNVSRISDEEEPKSLSPSDERYVTGVLNDSESELHAKWYEPPDSWESKHRWDPAATWTPEEQAKLTRRLGG